MSDVETVEEPPTQLEEILWNVGQIFKELREDKGLDQRTAAQMCGSSQARISPLENGRTDLKMSTLIRYANAYGYGIEINFVELENVDG